MFRFVAATALLISILAQEACAQNRRPVAPVRRNPTERVSPIPGVVLPTGVSQRNAEPLPAPTQVLPNGALPQPAISTGKVTAGPVDSVQVGTSTPPAAPARPRKRRP